MRSDDKHVVWVAESQYLCGQEIADDPEKLKEQVRDVEEVIEEIRDHMNEFYEVAPKVKEYFALLDKETRDRKVTYVENQIRGEEVCESELKKFSFRKRDNQVYSEVAKFRHPLGLLKDRLRDLKLVAVERGVGLPEEHWPKEFHYSDDYTWVKLGNREFKLTERQAKVIQILHDKHENGVRWVRANSIRQEVADDHRFDYPLGRFRDIFKSRPEVWRDLIVKDRKGNYRLNLPD